MLEVVGAKYPEVVQYTKVLRNFAEQFKGKVHELGEQITKNSVAVYDNVINSKNFFDISMSRFRTFFENSRKRYGSLDDIDFIADIKDISAIETIDDVSTIKVTTRGARYLDTFFDAILSKASVALKKQG